MTQEICKSGELDEISTTRKIRVLRAERQLPTTMQQWIEFMNDYLKLNSLPVIKGLGTISKKQAGFKNAEKLNVSCAFRKFIEFSTPFSYIHGKIYRKIAESEFFYLHLCSEN
ncbi:MAG: hypothetical protein LBU22_02050 [Dysgonamonadaceae bacterium]|jgi:hypothetical protein|nr:hypothetical protein [Dysgonamonadaceae bacterium]